MKKINNVEVYSETSENGKVYVFENYAIYENRDFGLEILADSENGARVCILEIAENWNFVVIDEENDGVWFVENWTDVERIVRKNDSRNRAVLENMSNSELQNVHDIVEDLIPEFLESLGINPFEDSRANLLWDFEMFLSKKITW